MLVVGSFPPISAGIMATQWPVMGVGVVAKPGLLDKFEQWVTPYAAQLHAANILSPEITFAFASVAVLGVSTLGLPLNIGSLVDSSGASFFKRLAQGLVNFAGGHSGSRARVSIAPSASDDETGLNTQTINLDDEGGRPAIALPSQRSGNRKTFSEDLVVFGRGDVFVDLSSFSSDADPVTLDIKRGKNAIAPGVAGLHTIFINDRYVSNRHARASYLPSQRALVVLDMGSSNGTSVNIDGEEKKVFGEERFNLKPQVSRVVIMTGTTPIKIDLPPATQRATQTEPEITKRIPRRAPIIPTFNADTVNRTLAHVLQKNRLQVRITVNGDIIVEVSSNEPSVSGSVKFLFPGDTSSDKVGAISESLIDRILAFKPAGTPTLDVIVTFMPREDLYDRAKYLRIASSDVEEGIIEFSSVITKVTQHFDALSGSIGVIGGISDKDFVGNEAGLPKINIIVPIEDDPANMQRILEMALIKTVNAIGDLGLSREIEDELAGIFRP